MLEHRTCQLPSPRLLVTMCAWLALAGCASLPLDLEAPSAADLATVLSKPDVPVKDYDLLGVSPQMKTFVKRVVPWRSGDAHRLSVLFKALNHAGSMKIDYDAGANLSAADVFYQRRANCLSFSALFIALAREAGFRARFQEVEVPPQWALMDNDILVRYQHVNSIVRLPRNHFYVAEFQRDRFDMNMRRRAISDDRAFGLFYLNLGAEFLFANDIDAAQAYFVRALEFDPQLSIGWVNLAAVHRRMARDHLAEIAYRQALIIDRDNDLAMSRLAEIYADSGRTELALELRERARSTRDKNPYYHYALAQKAYRETRFESAQQHLQSALKRNANEHRFHHLMALTLHELGAQAQAVKSLRLAEQNAVDNRDKRQYRTALAAWNAAPTQDNAR